MKLALFDLDNTLLSGDTDFEWHAFLVEEGALPPDALHENERMDGSYRDGSADVLEYVRFYLRPYARHDMRTLLAWRERFLEAKIVPKIAHGARGLVGSHDGDLAVMITATNRFLTEPIAAILGFRHLIATDPETAEGRFTGDVAGTPCMREGKIERLDAWLAARRQSLGDFRESWFYSDSINDLPLLSRVTHPVAVDPDARLERIARERNWRIITLRDGTGSP